MEAGSIREVSEIIVARVEQLRGASSMFVTVAPGKLQSPAGYAQVDEGLSPYGETGEGR